MGRFRRRKKLNVPFHSSSFLSQKENILVRVASGTCAATFLGHLVVGQVALDAVNALHHPLDGHQVVGRLVKRRRRRAHRRGGEWGPVGGGRHPPAPGNPPRQDSLEGRPVGVFERREPRLRPEPVGV